MRAFILLGAAALVAATPAPAAGFDFAAIQDAPAPTGPAPDVSYEDDVYDIASASSAAAAAASTVASAPSRRALEDRHYGWYGSSGSSKHSSSGSSKGPSPAKPAGPDSGPGKPSGPDSGPGKPAGPDSGPGKPSGPGPAGPGPAGPGPAGPGGKTTSCTTTATSTSTSSKATSTSTKCTTTSSTLSTSVVVTTSAPTSHEVPTTCTPVSWTNTFAFTSDTACPSPYEVGTYCGFINPEDPCAIQPDGFGPVSSPDTVDAFNNNAVLHQMAQNAADPKGYVSTFKDLSAAVNANTYLGYSTYETYDVQACADACDAKDLCTSFNFYIERDPKWNPDQCSCPQPDSITNYKCSLWGSGVDAAAAVNLGQDRGEFEVRIIGSNGYSKTEVTVPVTPPSCSKPQKCSGAHDHPSSCIGEHFFPGPFDASLCATYAIAQNKKNAAAGYTGKSSQCSFFNAFMIKQNYIAKGTYCKLFSQQYSSSAAGWTPSSYGGYKFQVESSWSYNLN